MIEIEVSRKRLDQLAGQAYPNMRLKEYALEIFVSAVFNQTFPNTAHVRRQTKTGYSINIEEDTASQKQVFDWLDQLPRIRFSPIPEFVRHMFHYEPTLEPVSIEHVAYSQTIAFLLDNEIRPHQYQIFQEETRNGYKREYKLLFKNREHAALYKLAFGT